MTGKILTLNDFRRDDAGPAKISTSKYEHHTQTLGRLPFVTLPDPLPKDWGEFWRASAFWSRRQATATGPSPESWRRVSICPK
jgi:hypothetical protein